MSVARPIPVFRPTTEEFADFSKYVTSIQPIAEQYGICKVVPPEGWQARISSYDDVDIEIPCPIRQHVHGKQGVYQVVNVMEKPMSLAQFKQASDEQFSKCFPKSKREGSDPEKFDMEELERRFWKNLTFHAPLYGADMLGTLFQEECDLERGTSDDDDEIIEVVDEPPAKSKKKSERSPKRKRGSKEPGSSGAPSSEREPAKHHAWNLGHLDTLLSQRLGKLLPGVTSPYLYFGMWKSLFACHTEDMDLYSINYLHFGKPKVWYGVPSAQKHRVDQVARLHFPMQHKECSEFLRHKAFMFSPNVLKTGNVSLTHAVQQPGEFIITFPGAYHFGFNAGFNCAEAVNFALERWLDFGKKAKPCRCVSDSVRIDVGMFINMVTNGSEMPVDTLPAAKKVKAEPTAKPKRVAKRRSKEKPVTPTKSPVVAKAPVVKRGRSMGLVAGRMTPVPQATALLPPSPEFVQETLADDEDQPVFSDDELRSGDENDGGEYLDSSAKRNKSKAQKPRRSKRMENKRGGSSSPVDASAEAPASSKVETRVKERKESPRKKSLKTATAPSVSVPGTDDQQSPSQETDKPSAVKRATKRKVGKLADHFPKKAKAQEETQIKPPEEAVSTREYQGLKIIIRPPRAYGDNDGIEGPADSAASAPRKQPKATKCSPPKKPKRGAHKAQPDPMPEGKITAWQQLHLEANHQPHRNDDAEHARVTTATARMSPVPSTPSALYNPTYLTLRQPDAPNVYDRYGERAHQQVDQRTINWSDGRPQPSALPPRGHVGGVPSDPRYSSPRSFPTLADFLSPFPYPPSSSSPTPSFITTSTPTTTAPMTTTLSGSAQQSPYSLMCELQRHKLKELREKQQQLQQLRQEQQPQLQQLQQFIQAQRQLHQQPFSAFPAGLPAPTPCLPTYGPVTTIPSSSPPPSSYLAAATGSSLPLPPPSLYARPLPPLPPHQHYRSEWSSNGAVDRAPQQAKALPVPILPSPSPVQALAALYAPIS